jgi:hypothetical protein
MPIGRAVKMAVTKWLYTIRDIKMCWNRSRNWKTEVDMSMLTDKMNDDIQRIIDQLEKSKLETNRWEKIRLVKQTTHSAEDYAFYWEEKLADLAG